MFNSGSFSASHKAKKSARSVPPENWFETLGDDQLNELCAACKVPPSASKQEMIAGLMSSAPEFAYLGRAKRLHLSRTTAGDDEAFLNLSFVGGRAGHTIASLKELCGAQGLRTSGDRFELVVRINRHRSGLDTGPPLKKVRIVGPDGAPKPRLTHDMDKLATRAAAWCTADKSTWSNQRWKYHADDVLTKALKVLQTNSGASASHALDIARALFKGIAAGASFVSGWGYGNALYHTEELANTVIAQIAASELTAEQVRI
jgi:hypothetical protein